MNYQQYLNICDAFGYDGQRRANLARTAALPYAKHLSGNPHVMPNMRRMPVFRAHPELLRVPLRRLNKWARRALIETVPRTYLMTGPVLAMWRQGVRL